jgi:hypothetical protein
MHSAIYYTEPKVADRRQTPGCITRFTLQTQLTPFPLPNSSRLTTYLPPTPRSPSRVLRQFPSNPIPGNNKYFPPILTTTYAQLTHNSRSPHSKIVLACLHVETFYPPGPIERPPINPRSTTTLPSPAYQTNPIPFPDTPQDAASHPSQPRNRRASTSLRRTSSHPSAHPRHTKEPSPISVHSRPRPTPAHEM